MSADLSRSRFAVLAAGQPHATADALAFGAVAPVRRALCAGGRFEAKEIASKAITAEIDRLLTLAYELQPSMSAPRRGVLSLAMLAYSSVANSCHLRR
ncbi:hypothetical protein ACFPPF_06635 [Xenophilus aerolatus]|nr:hypothetical protein [Xenophilus aerolatus]